MNEKIKTLIEQATRYDTVSGPYAESSFDEYKFAELIICKCASIVEAIDSNRLETFHRLDGEQVNTADVIKQYFGIK